MLVLPGGNRYDLHDLANVLLGGVDLYSIHRSPTITHYGQIKELLSDGLDDLGHDLPPRCVVNRKSDPTKTHMAINLHWVTSQLRSTVGLKWL